MHASDTEVESQIEAIFERPSRYIDQDPLLSSELITAKDVFFSMTGKIRDSDEEFGNRMNAFFMWFLFDYQIPSAQKSPLELYITKYQSEITGEDLAILNAQLDHIHSLFHFVKEKKGETVVKDLYSGKKHRVSENRVLVRQERDAFFETRLFRVGEELHFADYFIYHPLPVRKAIKRRIRQIRKANESFPSFLLKLHSYHTKWRRYRNIDINSIYHFNKSIPEAK